MQPLEQLFRLEIEFYRKLRIHANSCADARDLHTSYALQCGYEQLLRATGAVTQPDIERMRDPLLLLQRKIESPKRSKMCLRNLGGPGRL
jgi:hypothetical protein